MHLPRFRSNLMTSIALAGVVALSTLVGLSLLPGDMGGNAAHAESVIDFNSFFDALSPYGRWDNSPRYGQVWYPNDVQSDWRPYYDNGRWAYSDDDGWMWASDETWGWAPFHYGRWAFDNDRNWFWVPGRVWAPAWVTYRRSDDYIGWAPLSPEARWDPGYGYRDGNSDNTDINFWSFVRPEGFTARQFNNYAFDRDQYPTIINRTTNVTYITVINNRIVNNSIEVADVERFTNQRVERVRITEIDRPERTRFDGNNVVIYKPIIVEEGQTASDFQVSQFKEEPAEDNKKRAGKRAQQGNSGDSNEQPVDSSTIAPSDVEPSAGDNDNQKKKQNNNDQQFDGSGENQSLEQSKGNTRSEKQHKQQQQEQSHSSSKKSKDCGGADQQPCQ